MNTLQGIRQKYPEANHLPSPVCQICKGEGEWYDNRSGVFIRAGMRPCICIFVEHEFASTAAGMLAELAKKELSAMSKPKSE